MLRGGVDGSKKSGEQDVWRSGISFTANMQNHGGAWFCGGSLVANVRRKNGISKFFGVKNGFFDPLLLFFECGSEANGITG